MPNPPDLIFGKYEIQERLAIGGMGEVFLAAQKGLTGVESHVILKSLLPNLASQAGFIDQFLDEARVAATLKHPNVVSTYEVGLWNGTYYIAMEYIRGCNLAQLSKKAEERQMRLPASVVGCVIRDAAMGLNHAHRATDKSGNSLHIVHRDISPQNIMVREDGVTKVVDFGIAYTSNRAASRTATGIIKGKLPYMAPEQLNGEASSLVDQFALGVVFWELLAGRRLFKADSEAMIAFKVKEEAIRPPSSFAPNLPVALEAVVMRMLERDPVKRFASCAQVAAAIDYAMVGLTPGGASPVLELMKQLGADEPSTEPRAAAGNFVVSFNGNPQFVQTAAVDMSTRPKRLFYEVLNAETLQGRKPQTTPPSGNSALKRVPASVPVPAPPQRVSEVSPTEKRTPFEMSGINIAALAKALKDEGLFDKVSESVANDETRAAINNPSSAKWFSGAIMVDFYSTIIRVSSEKTMSDLNLRLLRDTIGPLASPLIKVALILGGRSQATLFNRLDSFSRIMQRGVAISWKQTDGSYGELRFKYEQAMPPNVVRAGWDGVLRFGDELTGKKTVVQNFKVISASEFVFCLGL